MPNNTERLEFGTDTICKRCRAKDRRGNAYGRGWRWWFMRNTILPGMVVLEELPNGWLRVQCSDCNGKGYVR